MNRVFGFYSFQKTLDPTLHQVTSFKNKIWTPDHEAHRYDEPIFTSATQRFITPECSHTLQPYQHPSSGCIIVADTYLTQRALLCSRLHVSSRCADIELILQAYLAWGSDLTRYLSGEFCFAIWDPKKDHLLLATDQFSKRPLLYMHQPKQFFAFSNECSAFYHLPLKLTLNENLFAHFALDALPAKETCFREVFKIQPGHQLLVTSNGIRESCYWRLKDQRQTMPHRTCDDYDAHFQVIFQDAVNDYLRSHTPITTHLSGGLDSSAVTAQAAHCLAEKNESLFAFTAIPRDLSGPSYRKGWNYHELPQVAALLRQYPNIHHHIYRTQPHIDLYELLQRYYPSVDQPFRNVSNLEWIIASMQYATEHHSRIILAGSRGNSGISKAAYSWKQWIFHWQHVLRMQMKPSAMYNHFFKNCTNSFLKSSKATAILRQHAPFFPNYLLLSAKYSARRHTSIYPLSLYHGVLFSDPTHDLAVVTFCYNVPSWVYRQGRGPLSNRLLVRRGLAHRLPAEITQNTHRGEQAADSFLHFNQHALNWYAQLDKLNAQTKKVLYQFYDQEKYARIQERLSISVEKQDHQHRMMSDYLFMRYLSAAFFLHELALKEVV